MSKKQKPKYPLYSELLEGDKEIQFNGTDEYISLTPNTDILTELVRIRRLLAIIGHFLLNKDLLDYPTTFRYIKSLMDLDDIEAEEAE